MKIQFLIYLFIIFLFNKLECKLNQTEENKFFLVNSSTIFQMSNNKNNHSFLNIQIFLCEQSNNSFIGIYSNGNKQYEDSIINSTQLTIPLNSINNMTLKAQSPKMYISYQYIDKDIELNSLKQNISEFAYNSSTIYFLTNPFKNNSNTTYELYFSKENKNILSECDRLLYSLNTTPKQVINLKEVNETLLNLTYSNLIGLKGYVFLKSININDISYVTLSELFSITQPPYVPTGKGLLMFIVNGSCILVILIAYYIIKNTLEKTSVIEIPEQQFLD